MVGDVTPATASVHLQRLKTLRLVKVLAQGKSSLLQSGRRQCGRGAPSLERAFEALGINVESTRTLRRRFAFLCVDWSERKPHLGGALGAALVKFTLKKKWVLRNLDSRVLGVTSLGRREMMTRFGLHV